MQLFAELRAVLLNAAAFEHQGIGNHLSDEVVAVLLCFCLAAQHRLPGLNPLGCGGGAVVINHSASSGCIDDSIFEVFRVAAWQEHVQHGFVCSGLAGGIAHLFFRCIPSPSRIHTTTCSFEGTGCSGLIHGARVRWIFVALQQADGLHP